VAGGIVSPFWIAALEHNVPCELDDPLNHAIPKKYGEPFEYAYDLASWCDRKDLILFYWEFDFETLTKYRQVHVLKRPVANYLPAQAPSAMADTAVE